MSRAAVPHGAGAARAPCWLPVVPGTREDGAVSHEAIVKLFTSCLVKRDHSVVEMKVFEIFIPVYMVLEWKTSGKQTKRPQTSSPKASWLMYGDGGLQGHGRGWHCPWTPTCRYISSCCKPLLDALMALSTTALSSCASMACSI